MGSHSSKVILFSPFLLNSWPEAYKEIDVTDQTEYVPAELPYLYDHSLSGLEAGSSDDVSDLGSVDLAVEFLIVEVEDLLELI